jgi:hypothetical protein
VEKITSEQWLSLKFQSWNGHDLAVPIDVEQNTLHPRALADYLTGGVPIDTRPVAWPDPHFMASQVMALWPSETPNQVSEQASEQAQTTKTETTADRISAGTMTSRSVANLKALGPTRPSSMPCRETNLSTAARPGQSKRP